MILETGHLLGSTFREVSPGVYVLQLKYPCTKPNKKYFTEEILTAQDFALDHGGCCVSWMHAGIRVDTSMEREPGGAWQHLLELRKKMETSSPTS